MRAREVQQDGQQLARVRHVVAMQSLTNVVADHVLDPVAAVGAAKQITRERCRDDLRHVLVLGDGVDLFLRQAAERDAVFDADHVLRPPQGVRFLTRISRTPIVPARVALLAWPLQSEGDDVEQVLADVVVRNRDEILGNLGGGSVLHRTRQGLPKIAKHDRRGDDDQALEGLCLGR